ncbi:MAG: hypothetical protein J6D06_07780 [Clostridia bacterium]|nr:hypothetical protein [Clostridia bacterium]
MKKAFAVLLSIVMCASLTVGGFAYWRDCDTFDVYVPEYFDGSENDYSVWSAYDDYEDDYYFYEFEYYEGDSGVDLQIEEYFGRVSLDGGKYSADSSEDYLWMLQDIAQDYGNLTQIGGRPAVVLSDEEDDGMLYFEVVVHAGEYFYFISLYGADAVSDAYYEVYDNIWGMDFYSDFSYYAGEYEEYYEEYDDYASGSASSAGGSASASSSGAGASSSGGTNNVVINNNVNEPTTSKPVASKPVTEKASVPNQQEKLEKAQTTNPSQVASTTAAPATDAVDQATQATTEAPAQNNSGSNTGLIVAIIVAAVIIGGALIAVCIVTAKKKK